MCRTQRSRGIHTVKCLCHYTKYQHFWNVTWPINQISGLEQTVVENPVSQFATQFMLSDSFRIFSRTVRCYVKLLSSEVTVLNTVNVYVLPAHWLQVSGSSPRLCSGAPAAPVCLPPQATHTTHLCPDHSSYTHKVPVIYMCHVFVCVHKVYNAPAATILS